jgi:hypothetical protein
MSAAGTAFLVCAALCTFVLPRNLAILPLLLAAAYTPAGEALDIGGATFTITRLLVALGFVRVTLRGETMRGRWTAIDALVILWAAILLGSSAMHTDDAWLFRLGIVWTETGAYFLARRLLADHAAVREAVKALVLLMIPLAVLMAIEKTSNANQFSVFASVGPLPEMREGKVRAMGPFAHSILAGTVGSVLLGLGLAVWRDSKWRSLVAVAGGATIVFACASSGPLLMTACVLLGYALMFCRRSMRPVLILAFIGLVALDSAMNDPIYFLMAKIDLVGGSQGYFRAQLIRSAIEHLDEWWLAGTDYTRHWMATGLKVSGRHTDITNHFLQMGVLGGLPLMAIFLAIEIRAFQAVGRVMRAATPLPGNEVLLLWGLGSVLFGLTVNFMSITLFDQSVIFFWLIIALIASMTNPFVRTVASASLPDTAPRQSPMTPRFDWERS